MPKIEPKIGPNKYIKLKDPIPKATAGLRTPFDPSIAAIAIPKSSDPPTTTPDIKLGVFP